MHTIVLPESFVQHIFFTIVIEIWLVCRLILVCSKFYNYQRLLVLKVIQKHARCDQLFFQISLFFNGLCWFTKVQWNYLKSFYFGFPLTTLKSGASWCFPLTCTVSLCFYTTIFSFFFSVYDALLLSKLTLHSSPMLFQIDYSLDTELNVSHFIGESYIYARL